MSSFSAFTAVSKRARASHSASVPASDRRWPALTKAILTLALTAALSPMAIAKESLTYKGTLSEHGKPANGNYEMQLQLFTEEFGGSQLGFAITLPNVLVKDGSFQVPVDLPNKLPEEKSVWLQAQIKPAGASDFYPLDGRQEIKATTGAVCWETTGNAALTGGTVGIPGSAPGSLLALTNRGSTLFLRPGGGIEQNAATAAGLQAFALQNSSAAGPSSFTAGKGATSAAHSFSMVFADGQGAAASFGSTAANQFLVRAQNGVGINTNAPRGTFSVQRGGVSGAGAVSASAITAESDTNMYITLLTPGTQERGILFGDQTNTAMGGIIFDTLFPANDNGMSFRTGGNVERLRITSGGVLVSNEAVLRPEDDVHFKNASGSNSGQFQLSLSASDNERALIQKNPGVGTGRLIINNVDGGDILIQTPVGRIETPNVFGIGRSAATNRLEVEGNASKTTAGDWLANSDRRIKQDIASIDNALALLNRLEPVTFRYSDAYRGEHPFIARDQRYYNVIAQDFAKVFPDAVKGSGEYLPGAAKTQANEILQVDTYPATITAIAAIQELDAKSTLQDERVAKLEAENAELRARLANIERRLGTSAEPTR